MGIPFEALLPYGIMIGVCPLILPPTSPSFPLPPSFSAPKRARFVNRGKEQNGGVSLISKLTERG